MLIWGRERAMKKIGIGYENYKEFVDQKLYYVDKTLLIRDVVEKGGKVTLFTRPRRFGKTLALSMLRTFFEQEYDDKGDPVDNHRYFEGKKIMDAPEEILSMMGRYPVIKLSLKTAKQTDYREAALQLRDEIVSEFNRHIYIEESDKLTTVERQGFSELLSPKKKDDIENEDDFKKEIGRYATALKTLSQCLNKYHGEKVIVLIDEYDVPLENAYYEGFYDEMVVFIRSLFESVLKTNDALQFGVATGCLRISKESIFTGLNHLKINSVLDESFSEGFGFTSGETEQMLIDYGIADRMPEVKEWYNGYVFGEKEIYNPWSVINYIDSVVNGHRKFPTPFWANTSSNSIIKDLVWQADEEMKRQLDTLIGWGTIEKKIHEDITYDDVHESENDLWNFLFFTGYMGKVSERKDGEDIYLTMRIPNREIRSIYRNHISTWFEKRVKETNKSELNRAVLEGDTDGIAGYVTGLLKKCISTFDSQEGFYHGFLLSLLYEVPDYAPKSNREEGNGRPDITLYPDNPRDPAIIFEVKVRKKYSEMEEGLQEAYDQIIEKKYEEGILDDGYLGVKPYGICFCKKSCIVGALPG
ncbi:MAG: AAA family ATPase [Lachnospiraceae bacterium]|nr:AAA family ATPase [Lachnospiraceae bacterium]